jgi:hypothetical protein
VWATLQDLKTLAKKKKTRKEGKKEGVKKKREKEMYNCQSGYNIFLIISSATEHSIQELLFSHILQ